MFINPFCFCFLSCFVFQIPLSYLTCFLILSCVFGLHQCYYLSKTTTYKTPILRWLLKMLWTFARFLVVLDLPLWCLIYLTFSKQGFKYLTKMWWFLIYHVVVLLIYLLFLLWSTFSRFLIYLWPFPEIYCKNWPLPVWHLLIYSSGSRSTFSGSWSTSGGSWSTCGGSWSTCGGYWPTSSLVVLDLSGGSWRPSR